MKHTRRSALLGFIACLTGVGVAKKRPTQPIGLSMKQMDQFMDHLKARGIFRIKDLRAEKFCILTGPIHVVPAQITSQPVSLGWCTMVGYLNCFMRAIRV